MQPLPSTRRSGRITLRQPQIRLPGILTFGCYHHDRAQQPLLPHTHPGSMEICFLVRGRQSYRVDDRIYRLQSGDIYITHPDERHDSAAAPEEKGMLYWIQIRMHPGEPLLFLERSAARNLRQTLRELPGRHFKAEPGAEKLLARIMSILVSENPDALQRLTAANLVLSYLLSVLRAARRSDEREPSPRMQRCADHVRQHIGDSLRVDSLAALARLSPSRFKTRFRGELGLSPGEFILREKIAAAQLRLRGRDSITQIAYGLGFSSSQYFATAFKRITGETPRAWRKMSRGPG